MNKEAAPIAPIAEVTIDRAAKTLGKDQSQVRRYVRAGLLPARKVGGKVWLLDAAAVDNFVPPPVGRRKKIA